MLIRDCFQGQLPDPFIHMDHEGALDKVPHFWVNTKNGMAKPTFSFTKPQLMSRTIPELYPDLLRLMVYYWRFRENLPHEPLADEAADDDFQTKLQYVKDHADPRFVRLDPTTLEQDDEWSEKRTEIQTFADDFLKGLNLLDLKLLCAPNQSIDSVQRARRGTLNDLCRTRHADLMKTLPSKLHYPPPSNTMLRRRAADAVKAREK